MDDEEWKYLIASILLNEVEKLKEKELEIIRLYKRAVSNEDSPVSVLMQLRDLGLAPFLAQPDHEPVSDLVALLYQRQHAVSGSTGDINQWVRGVYRAHATQRRPVVTPVTTTKEDYAMHRIPKPEVTHFADRITAMGYIVYIADDGRYGFITDSTELRVLGFSFNDGTSLSGIYGPASIYNGTGWRMDEKPDDLETSAQVHDALYAQPPRWVHRGQELQGWKYLTTVAQYLASYDRSSKFYIHTPKKED